MSALRSSAIPFAKALDGWHIHQAHRQTGTVPEEAEESLASLKFLSYSCQSVKALAKAALTFNQLVALNPEFRYEDGTMHPINTVLSIKRLHFFCATGILRLMPKCLSDAHSDLQLSYQMEVRSDWLKDTGCQVPGKDRALRSRYNRSKNAMTHTALDAINSIKNCMKYAEKLYKTGQDHGPLEIMSNFHRFNSTKNLDSYLESFSIRKLVMDSFRDTCEAYIITLQHVSEGNRQIEVIASDFDDFKTTLTKTVDWIKGLEKSFKKTTTMLQGEEQAAKSKKMSKNRDTAKLLKQLQNHCTFCGDESKEDLIKCSSCNVAKYCTKACLKTYQLHHEFLCGKGEDLFQFVSEITEKDLDEIIKKNRLIKKGSKLDGKHLLIAKAKKV